MSAPTRKGPLSSETRRQIRLRAIDEESERLALDDVREPRRRPEPADPWVVAGGGR